MIFENKRLTELVIEWKKTHDKKTLSKILIGCESLVEVIVSSYDPEYRDDLKQEGFARIQYALEYYDPNVSKLHSYLTTVIRNICNTYISKVAKYEHRTVPLDVLEYNDESATRIGDSYEENILAWLKERNRTRFPNIPVFVVDDATETVFDAIIENSYGKAKGSVTSLMEEFDLKRSAATAIYHSTLIYIRRIFMDRVEIDMEELTDVSNYSLLHEMREMLGDDVFKEVALVFSGLYVRFP